MKIYLPYGKTKLTVKVPDNARIIAGRPEPPLHNATAALEKSLLTPDAGPPLPEITSPTDRVAIVHTDITRATPNRLILPVIVSLLEESGIPPEQITLINATGTHRPQTPHELEEMLGPEMVRRCKIVQHDALNREKTIHAGSLETGNAVFFNRDYMEADIRIVTGFIEPHFFAGFSGGPKALLPGIAGMSSIMENHSPDNINTPSATWGITRGNPIWEEIAAAAELAPPEFMVNVALNSAGEITAVFSGELFAAHRIGCNFVRDQSMVHIDSAADIVITSNSGYPLDQNLYQAVKGLSAAAAITRPGGSIIMAAACSDGIPSHGHFGEFLRNFPYPEDFLSYLNTASAPEPDQWQMQIFAHLALRYRIFLISAGLREENIQGDYFTLAESVEAALEAAQASVPGPPEIVILPEGPQTIAVAGS